MFDSLHHCISALTSAQCGIFNGCAKAFAKLEALPNISPAEREQIENLAFVIFTK